MRMATSDRKYRGMSREARREQRRRQFIEAGHALFGSEGYQAASVKKLCREAELTERYFYESFKRREDLFAACYDEKLDLLFTTLLENLTSGTRSVEQIVVDGLLSLFRTLRDDQHMARILMIEIYGVPYDQQRLYERSIGRFSDMLLQFMQRFLPAPIPMWIWNCSPPVLSACVFRWPSAGSSKAIGKRPNSWPQTAC